MSNALSQEKTKLASRFLLAGAFILASLSGIAQAAQSYGDWRDDRPGVSHRVAPDDLAAPYATRSKSNGPDLVQRPVGALPAVPPGFTVKPFATGLQVPRVLRVAPNGDIFLAETGADRVLVLRAADGADRPEKTTVFASGLSQPFGIAFYPPGPNPKYVYVAATDRLVRYPYAPGAMTAQGPAKTILANLPTGGHSTRDVVVSSDGAHLYLSIGSASNIATDMGRLSAEALRAQETAHGTGSAWGFEQNRAVVLQLDPDGRNLRPYATGLRNCVGEAIAPGGGLWCATNERDGLGDDLPPDYATKVQPGGFYGWPWFYIGAHPDPRHPDERPDLVESVIVPDVLLAPHSAPLGITFYDGVMFPTDYRGDAFVTLHGSWNRGIRTGYKVVRLRFVGGRPTGGYEDFLTGFVSDEDSVWGRPVGVAVAHDGALLVSEDAGGTIWRVSK